MDRIEVTTKLVDAVEFGLDTLWERTFPPNGRCGGPCRSCIPGDGSEECEGYASACVGLPIEEVCNVCLPMLRGSGAAVRRRMRQVWSACTCDGPLAALPERCGACLLDLMDLAVDEHRAAVIERGCYCDSLPSPRFVCIACDYEQGW